MKKTSLPVGAVEPPTAGGSGYDRRGVRAWALFDFANSIYPAVITTAVFPVFYVSVVVGDTAGDGVGELWFTRAVALSALIVALSAPILGAIADRIGMRKSFLAIYVGVCLAGVLAMTSLGPGMILAGFLFFVVANVGFEGALVFYNAYLPDLAPPEKRGYVSALGFGVGYLGSALGLILVLPFATDLVFATARIELAWVIVAVFFLLFSIPTFRAMPKDRPGGLGVTKAASEGIAQVKRSLALVKSRPNLRNFLLAYFFYIDGILTVIVMAGIIANETFGFSQQQTIILFLIVQFSALIGSFSLAHPTDRFGPKRVLLGVLAWWTLIGVAAYFVRDATVFWVLAVFAGLGLGSAQSASRALMASLIPRGKEAEMFGFYALCGKTSSILGPLLFGWITFLAAGNQRPGFLLLTGFFIAGSFLLLRVRDPRLVASAGSASDRLT